MGFVASGIYLHAISHAMFVRSAKRDHRLGEDFNRFSRDDALTDPVD
jgi:hypothetical protein